MSTLATDTPLSGTTRVLLTLRIPLVLGLLVGAYFVVRVPLRGQSAVAVEESATADPADPTSAASAQETSPADSPTSEISTEDGGIPAEDVELQFDASLVSTPEDPIPDFDADVAIHDQANQAPTEKTDQESTVASPDHSDPDDHEDQEGLEGSKLAASADTDDTASVEKASDQGFDPIDGDAQASSAASVSPAPTESTGDDPWSFTESAHEVASEPTGTEPTDTEPTVPEPPADTFSEPSTFASDTPADEPSAETESPATPADDEPDGVTTDNPGETTAPVEDGDNPSAAEEVTQTLTPESTSTPTQPRTRVLPEVSEEKPPTIKITTKSDTNHSTATTSPSRPTLTAPAATTNRSPDVEEPESEVSAEPKLQLTNPKQNPGPVYFLLDRQVHSLHPGQTLILTGSRTWTIRFDRGGTLGEFRRPLSSGAYQFQVDRTAGWTLR